MPNAGAMSPGRWLLFTLAAAAAACSLTPIPDLSSDWVEPCEAPLRRCSVEFLYQAGAEKTVELRGDFRDGGWVEGEPMAKEGAYWKASVPLQWGSSVQYKFLLDGSRWVLDPTNPRSVPDGMGNTNSLLESVSCARWVCVP